MVGPGALDDIDTELSDKMSLLLWTPLKERIWGERSHKDRVKTRLLYG
jgi:hypothetical protein